MAKSLFEQLIDKTITNLSLNDLKGLKIVGNEALRGCLSLTDVELPVGVTNIGENAFSGCTALKNVVIPEGVNNLEMQSFSGCTGLTTLTIPSTVTSIGLQAFSSCTMPNVYFRQPSGLSVSLPNAGVGMGMFYIKNARTMNIYTDNETIKNYDWATDNITATLYHLNGTAW